MAKTEVAVKSTGNEVATATAFDAFAGQGLGRQTSSDYLIPRIAVLGDLSPQLKKNKAEYIEGSEVGDIVDVAMGEILAKQGAFFDFLPVARVVELIEWKPRSAGGGIVKREIMVDSMETVANRLGIKPNDKFEYINKAGNELIETHQIYGINLSSANRWSFVPMKKSNLKIARKWFTKATAITLPNGGQAPLFYKTWKFGSFLDSGNSNEWWNWIIKDGPLLQELPDFQKLFEASVKLLEAVNTGDAQADMRGEEATDSKSEVM